MHTVNTHTHSSSNILKMKGEKKELEPFESDSEQWTVEVCLHLHLPQLNNNKESCHTFASQKAYTYLHFISSHLGYVVRKCYDFRTTVVLFYVVRRRFDLDKTAFDSYAKLTRTVTNWMRFVKWNRHAWKPACVHGRIMPMAACYCTLFFINCLHFEHPLHRSRNTSASTFIAQDTKQSTLNTQVNWSLELTRSLSVYIFIHLYWLNRIGATRTKFARIA